MNKDLMKKIEKFLENINEIKRSDSEVDFDFRTTIEIFYDMNDFYKNKKRYIRRHGISIYRIHVIYLKKIW